MSTFTNEGIQDRLIPEKKILSEKDSESRSSSVLSLVKVHVPKLRELVPVNTANGSQRVSVSENIEPVKIQNGPVRPSISVSRVENPRQLGFSNFATPEPKGLPQQTLSERVRNRAENKKLDRALAKPIMKLISKRQLHPAESSKNMYIPIPAVPEQRISIYKVNPNLAHLWAPRSGLVSSRPSVFYDKKAMNVEIKTKMRSKKLSNLAFLRTYKPPDNPDDVNIYFESKNQGCDLDQDDLLET